MRGAFNLVYLDLNNKYQPIGLSSIGFGKNVSPDSAFEQYAELKFSKGVRHDRGVRLDLEIGADHANKVYDNIPKYKRLAQDCGVSVSAVHADPNKNIASKDERVRQAGLENVRKAIVVAAEFGADRVVVHPGYELVDERYRDRFPDRGSFEDAADSLAELAAFAYASDTRLCVENLPYKGALGSSPERFSKILRMARNQCNSKRSAGLIGATIDLGHVHKGECSVAEYVSALDGRYKDVYHTHLHYNDGKSDQHRPMVGVDTGWEAELRDLGKGLGADATHTMEIHSFTEDDLTGSIDTLYKNKYFNASK